MSSIYGDRLYKFRIPLLGITGAKVGTDFDAIAVLFQETLGTREKD